MIQSVPTVLRMIIRILVACICGGAIGFERTKRLKEAGVRTHCIIAAGSALVMLVSKYGFSDLAVAAGDYAGTRGTDPARLAAQVISGISFLGAGVIFKNGNSVKGLTTAAGIWVTAAVGIAIGSGMYVPGIVGTVVVMMVQVLFHRYSIGNDAYSDNDVYIIVEDSDNFREMFLSRVREKHIQIISMKIEREADGTVCHNIVLRTRKNFDVGQAIDLFNSIKGVRSITMK